jgi:hypothetical protein
MPRNDRLLSAQGCGQQFRQLIARLLSASSQRFWHDDLQLPQSVRSVQFLVKLQEEGASPVRRLALRRQFFAVENPSPQNHFLDLVVGLD